MRTINSELQQIHTLLKHETFNILIKDNQVFFTPNGDTFFHLHI